MPYLPGQHYLETSRTNYFKRHYVVKETMEFQTLIKGKQASILRADGKILARLEKDGMLYVYPEYAWDGPSGPTIDTHAFILASCAHDVLYQMLRDSLLINKYHFVDFMGNFYPGEYYRKFVELRALADKTMKELNLKYGMSRFRAWYTWLSVQTFGEKHAMPKELLNEEF